MGMRGGTIANPLSVGNTTNLSGSVGNPASVGRTAKASGSISGKYLLAHWPCNEGSGTTVADISGHGYTLSMFNQSGSGIEWSADTPGAIAGAGGCLSTNTAEISLGNAHADLPKLVGKTSRTYCFWHKVSGDASQVTFFWDDLSTKDGSSVFRKWSTTAICGINDKGDGFVGQFNSTATPSDNAWHHFAFAWTGKKWMHYQDGVFMRGDANPSFKLRTVQGITGVFLANGSDGSFARVKDVRVYGVALTKAQIAALAGI